MPHIPRTWLYATLCAHSAAVISAPPSDPIMLPDMQITGSHFPATAINHASRSVSRDVLDWFSIPGSISTFGEESFQTFQANRFEDIANYSAGILEGADSSGFNTGLFVRGYDSLGKTFLNGSKDIGRFFSRDPLSIDRVEILKGHSAIMYGQGRPGGTVQFFTKKPQRQHQTTLGVSFGNYAFKRTTLDSTGSLSPDQSLQYRLLGAWQDANTFRDNVSNDRWQISPSLQWEYAADSHVLLEFEYAVNKQPFYFSTVFARNRLLLDHDDGRYVDPRAHSHREYKRGAVYIDHKITDHWRILSTTQYAKVDRDDVLFGYLFKIDDNTLNGYYRDIDDNYTQLNVQLETLGEVHIGSTIHHILAGISRDRTSADLISMRDKTFTLDIFNPVFPVRLPTGVPLNRFVMQDNRHAYFNNRIEIGESLIVNGGIRWSDFKIKSDSGRGFRTATDQDTRSVSGGLLYKLDKALMLYASYSEAFEPNLGRDRQDNFFAPLESYQFEFGIKTSLAQMIDLQLALYQLTQDNLTTTDPLDRDFQILAGKRRSRGLELEIAGQLQENLSFKTSYTLMGSQYVKNNDGLEGNSPGNIPRHHGSLQLKWSPNLSLPLTLSSGVILVSERWGDDGNTFKLPGYVRWDLGLDYSLKNILFNIGIKNILNKTYAAAAFSQGLVYRGEARTIRGSIQYRF